MDLDLIRPVDIGFKRMLSDPHCRYTEPIGGTGCNQTGGHGFQKDVIRSSLQVCYLFFYSVEVHGTGRLLLQRHLI